MHESKWPESFAVIAIALAFIAIFFPWERTQDWPWEAWSAIGTVAAVFVALGLASWSTVKEHRAQLSRGLFLAAGYVIRMRHTASALKTVAEKTAEAALVDASPEVVEIIAQILKTSRLPEEPGTLLIIAPVLPRNEALALATAMGTIESLGKQLELATHLYQNPNQSTYRMKLMKTISENANGARSILVKVDATISEKVGDALK
ncbi:hypothetical protein [Achromobacter aloeverae]